MNKERRTLTYDKYKDIYRESILGKRIVEAIVNFAMSSPREIIIQDAPQEVVEKFQETALLMEQDNVVKQTLYYSRIYGTSALFASIFNTKEKKVDLDIIPVCEEADDYAIKFIPLDPLNLSGSSIDINPLSVNFLEFNKVRIKGKDIRKGRIHTVFGMQPLYLDNRTSLIPYSPPSVYYNIIDLIDNYNQAIESVSYLLYKAGAIIHKYPPKSKLSGVSKDAVSYSQSILQQKENGSIISIPSDASLENFPIGNFTGLIDMINKLEDSITKGLNDTPVTILFDRNLSNGFSEGDKDKQTEISLVEAYRVQKVKPLYDFTDYFVMLKAWDKSFIEEMRIKYGYENITNTELFRRWSESFSWNFGNLFPEPESTVQDINNKKLNNLKVAVELGANRSDIQEELNEMKIFRNDISLDQPLLFDNEDNSEEFI